MPQAGFDPLAQSDTCYESDALPPSHHGWISVNFVVETPLPGFPTLLKFGVFCMVIKLERR